MKCVAIVAAFTAVAVAVPFNNGLFADGEFDVDFDSHFNTNQNTSRHWDNKEDLLDASSKDHGSELIENSQHTVDSNEKGMEHLIHDEMIDEHGNSKSSLNHKKSFEKSESSNLTKELHSKDFGEESRVIDSSKSSLGSEEESRKLLADMGLAIDADGKIACDAKCIKALTALIGQE